MTVPAYNPDTQVVEAGGSSGLGHLGAAKQASGQPDRHWDHASFTLHH